MIGNLKRTYIENNFIINNLKEGIDLERNDIKINKDDLVSSFFKQKDIGFNQQNNFNSFINIIKETETDIDFIKSLNDYTNNFANMLLLNNAINKTIITNKLKLLETEIKYNQEEENLYTSLIVFNDLININFDINEEFPKTTSFIDLLNNKTINNRVDLMVGPGNYSIKIKEGTFATDNESYNLIPTGSMYTTKFKNIKDVSTGNIIYEITYHEKIKANRLAFDFLYVSDASCKITILSNNESIVINNDIIEKEHHDLIFSEMMIDKITIQIKNVNEKTFDFGIRNFQLYYDLYELESVLCTKPINVKRRPFKVELNTTELPGTKCYFLIGLIKDKQITWKDSDKFDVYNHLKDQNDIEQIIIVCKLKGTKHNTPIINSIIIKTDINVFISDLYELEDFKDENKGELSINFLTNKITDDTIPLPGKGKIVINLNGDD